MCHQGQQQLQAHLSASQTFLLSDASLLSFSTIRSISLVTFMQSTVRSIRLVTFTLRISEEISRFHYNEILGDNCQFLFQQQSSLVRFLIMCFFFYFRFSHFFQQFSKYSSEAQKNHIFVILVKFVVKFMFFFVRTRTSGSENYPELQFRKNLVFDQILDFV